MEDKVQYSLKTVGHMKGKGETKKWNKNKLTNPWKMQLPYIIFSPNKFVAIGSEPKVRPRNRRNTDDNIWKIHFARFEKHTFGIWEIHCIFLSLSERLSQNTLSNIHFHKTHFDQSRWRVRTELILPEKGNPVRSVISYFVCESEKCS